MEQGIVGREAELASLARFTESTRTGPALLLLEGEAGIGKTLLWQEGIELASRASCRVLGTRPAQSETRLSFAGLADLLSGVLEDAGRSIPPPQQRALNVALRRSDPGSKPIDHLALSVGALGVLRHIAAADPLVLAIDDLQWLDGPTARVLEFVARRLIGERVGILATIRSEKEDGKTPWIEVAMGEHRLQRVRVGPLSLGALHRLLNSRLGSEMPNSIVARIHRASGGNPFVALEMAQALARSGGDLAASRLLPIPGTVRELVDARIARLPVRARRLLVTAAALSRPTIDSLERSAATPELVRADIDKARRAGLIEQDGDAIRFTHPLLASIPYSQVPASDRRALHRRLAEVVTEPEERARHLALASTGPDSDVAAALDAAAVAARARGAPDAAAELCELARDLTPSDHADDRWRREIAAAEHTRTAGDFDRARDVLEGVVRQMPHGPARADALRRLATVHYYAHSFDVAADLLAEALTEVGEDRWVKANVREAFVFVQANRGRTVEAAEHARIALDLARGLEDHGLLARALTAVGFSRYLLGEGIDPDLMEQALSLEEDAQDVPPERRPIPCFASILGWIGESERSVALLEEAQRSAIERGDEAALPVLAYYLSRTEVPTGNLVTAMRHAEVALEACERTGYQAVRAYVLATKAMIEALMGRADEVRASAEEGLALARALGAGPAMIWSISALGFLELSLGNPAGAHALLGPLIEQVSAIDVREPTVFTFVPDGIEALIALGEAEQAERHLAWFEERGRALDRAWALATAHRCRGLLFASRGDLAGAERSLGTALTEHARLVQPFELGRTLLVLGQVRRREKKKRPAREALERSLAIFESLPAPLWAKKARSEIGRIGGRAASPTELSATERQVAELVASGMTNREAADALFVSVHTVEANLKRIYAKLGLRSRTELAHTLLARAAVPARAAAGSDQTH